VIVEIRAVNGPGRRCNPTPEHGCYEDVQVGVGRFSDPIGVVPGDTQGVEWRVPVRVVWWDGELDFRGPQVDGKRGDRHIYLNWFNREPDGQLRLFRRGKVMLEGLDPRLVKQAEGTGSAVTCTVKLTTVLDPAFTAAPRGRRRRLTNRCYRLSSRGPQPKNKRCSAGPSHCRREQVIFQLREVRAEHSRLASTRRLVTAGRRLLRGASLPAKMWLPSGWRPRSG